MEFLLIIALLVALTVVPVMVGARVMRADNTGFGTALFAVVLLAALSAAIEYFIANQALAFLVAVAGGAAILAGVLRTTLLRGLAVSVIVVGVQLLVLLVAAGTSAFAQAAPASRGDATVDARCFADAANRVQFDFRTWEAGSRGWIGGQVRYRNGKAAIPIVFQGSTVLEDHDGRPSEFEHRWIEVLDGTVTGEYRLRSQGAVVYDMRYLNRRSGRTTTFPEGWHADAEDGDGCAWR